MSALTEHLKDTARAGMELDMPERTIGHPVETAGEPEHVIGQANEIRKFRRRKAYAQAAAMCNADSVTEFLRATDWLKDALEQINREGHCLACGFTLIGGDSECARCGRNNS